MFSRNKWDKSGAVEGRRRSAVKTRPDFMGEARILPRGGDSAILAPDEQAVFAPPFSGFRYAMDLMPSRRGRGGRPGTIA